jgi:hypothetical protein
MSYIGLTKNPNPGYTCPGLKEPPKNANWTSEDVATSCRDQIQAYGEKAFPFCMHKYGSIANLNATLNDMFTKQNRSFSVANTVANT